MTWFPKKLDTQTLTKMGLCLALICVSSYIAIPIPFTPVLITAQTIIVSLIALLLSPAQSAFIMAVYIIMGTCGLPIFSGGMGGIGKLLGPAGGYLIGFLVAVVCIGLLKGKTPRFWRYLLVTIGVGMPVIYFFAVFYMVVLNGMEPMAAFLSLVVPFIAGDAAKCVAASALAFALNKLLIRARVAA